MTDTGPSIAQIKDGLRATWMAGDFGVIARQNVRRSEDFVERLAIPPGTHVLDVATGSGNVAIPLARAGCVVTGLDISPHLLEQAEARAAAEGLTIEFEEGDAENMPYAESSFDAVVSMFGAMFAPRPDVVACELARVLKPGGRLAMANWRPEGFVGEMSRILAKHVPPPPGIVAPTLWGVEATARERLADSFTEIQCKVISLPFDLPMSPAAAVGYFRTYFGPMKVGFSRLDERGQAALQRDLIKHWKKENTASDPEQQTLIPNEYLEVQAIKNKG